MKARICSERCPYAVHAADMREGLSVDGPPLCVDCPELGMIHSRATYGRVELKPHWIRSIMMVRARDRREARAAARRLIAAE
ncbi:MAG TPA: hypothetical protein VJB97_00950 [Candidatus Paceibacterota bacterium]